MTSNSTPAEIERKIDEFVDGILGDHELITEKKLAMALDAKANELHKKADLK